MSNPEDVSAQPMKRHRRVLADDDEEEWIAPQSLSGTKVTEKNTPAAEILELPATTPASITSVEEENKIAASSVSTNFAVDSSKAPASPASKKKVKTASSGDDSFALSGVLAPMPGHRTSAGHAFASFFGMKKKPNTATLPISSAPTTVISTTTTTSTPLVKDTSNMMTDLDFEPSSATAAVKVEVDNVALAEETTMTTSEILSVVKEEVEAVSLRETTLTTTNLSHSAATTLASAKRPFNPFDMMMGKSKVISKPSDVNTALTSMTSPTPTTSTSAATASETTSTSLISTDSSTFPIVGVVDVGEEDYDPILHAGWLAGQKVPYSALAKMFQKCEDTTKRLKIIACVSDFFRSVIALSPQELLPCIYLCVNQVYPDFEGKELGIGDQILLKALSEACGSTLNDIKARYRTLGDLGAVAEESRAKQRVLMRPAKLTVSGVFLKLREIADMTGSKSGEKKKDAIKQLIVSAQGHEARFIARALQGNLRIHLALLSVLKALSRAVVLTPPILPVTDSGVEEDTFANTASPSPTNDMEEDDEEGSYSDDDGEGDYDKEGKKRAANPKVRTPTEIKIQAAHKRIEAAYNDCPSFEKLTEAITTLPLTQLHKKCSLTPGLPIKVMLGKPARGVMEVVKKFEGRKFTLEYKYDGERAQIHKLPDGSIRIYSRHQENNTGKYPDIIQKLPSAVLPGVDSFIIDAEVVAWDPKEHKILPFQTLSTRKRKDVKEEDVEVQVLVFAFDLLYLNGTSYMRQPFEKRRDALHASFKITPGIFDFAKYLDSTDPEDIDTFLQQAVTDSCEGLMVKPLDLGATYVPDKRNWIKVKKDYLDGVGDTLDLVPLGAWYGKGKRTGTFGAFLMYCHNDNDGDEIYQSVVRIGTGFKDTDLDELTKLLTPHIIESPPRYYVQSSQPQLIPHVWFKPMTVWEVKCADLSISPEHKAAVGMVHESNGISIRFPRFIRLRPDKKPEHATSAEQIADMYLAQNVVQNSGVASGPTRRPQK